MKLTDHIIVESSINPFGFKINLGWLFRILPNEFSLPHPVVKDLRLEYVISIDGHCAAPYKWFS